MDPTGALFEDAGVADGVARIDDDPALNYEIVDETQNTNAEYEIHYQVEWVADFDRIEIQVENIDASHIAGETFVEGTKEGIVSYPSGGGSDGGAEGDTYRFTFEVYETSSSAPVLTEVVDDVADGDGQSQGDMGTVDDPELDGFDVIDETRFDNTDYTVQYRLSNVTAQNFGEVTVTFDHLDSDWADETATSTDEPTGSVSYSQGGTGGETYEITVDVKNENGLVVDSATITDVADGTDAQWP